MTTNKGSCLEYGHSCWGAHGKRSGSKSFNTAVNMANGEFNGAKTNGEVLGKAIYDNLEELPPSIENSPLSSDELVPENLNDKVKIKNILQQNSNFRQQSRNFNKKTKQFKNDAASEHDEENQNPERWHRMPFYNFKSFGKLPINAEGNNFLQQLEAAQRANTQIGAEDNAYYDFN
ncbi:uncharacterized protein LOC119676836 [Teleopsis dalmanni]|uniref:uncharacterized protein LOC119676836 n=1 Tax=Teleopsis dalmanni TaxID=139649 RepID=UPI0018CCC7A7|nr:uncharacterized protein LOC119676836 [Teleopsis dalmanni]